MKNHDLTIRHKILSFGNILCAAQRLAWPKSSFPFYENLYTYVSPRVSAYRVHFPKGSRLLGWPTSPALKNTLFFDINLKFVDSWLLPYQRKELIKNVTSITVYYVLPISLVPYTCLYDCFPIENSNTYFVQKLTWKKKLYKVG